VELTQDREDRVHAPWWLDIVAFASSLAPDGGAGQCADWSVVMSAAVTAPVADGILG
jgi:hypothetical protein